MNTKHLNKNTGAAIHELAFELQERIRRASAPTLRDLQTALTESGNAAIPAGNQGADKTWTYSGESAHEAPS